MKNSNINIGQEIEKIVKERGYSKAEYARKLGIKPQSVAYQFERVTIETDMLLKVCRVLEHDFFELYQGLLKQTNFDIKTKKAKVLVEVELSKDDMVKLKLKDRIINILENSE